MASASGPSLAASIAEGIRRLRSARDRPVPALPPPPTSMLSGAAPGVVATVSAPRSAASDIAEGIRSSRRRSKGGVVSMLVHHVEAGTLTLPIPDVRCETGVDTIDLTFLLALENVWLPLAHAFERTLKGRTTAISREGKRVNLAHFVAHLERASMLDCQLADLSYATFLAFKRDLDDPAVRPHYAHEYSRGYLLRDVQATVCALLKDKRWKAQCSTDLRPLVNPYPGAKRSVVNIEPLAPAELGPIMAAAKGAVVATTAMLRAFWKVEDAGKDIGELLAMAPTCPDHAALLLDRIFPGEIPQAAWFTKGERLRLNGEFERLGIGGRVSQDRLAKIVFRHRLTAVRTRLYPSITTLAPFAVLFAARLALNPTPLLEMELDDVVLEDPLGRPCFAANLEKRRQQGFQPVSWRASKDADNPAEMFVNLRRWGSRARDMMPATVCQRLFAHETEGRGTAYNSHAFAQGSGRFASFLLRDEPEREPLPAFQLRQFRTTTLEIVDEMADGDIAVVMGKGGQRSEETVYSHYSTKAVAAGADERIGVMIAIYGRFFRTAGEIDPRDVMEREDMGAATRGFVCLNPFASPIPGSRTGRMCEAVGHCPICPFAAVDTTSVLAFARLKHLERAYCSLRDEDPDTYRARFLAPHLRLTRFWLGLFDQEVRDLVDQIPAQPPIRMR